MGRPKRSLFWELSAMFLNQYSHLSSRNFCQFCSWFYAKVVNICLLLETCNYETAATLGLRINNWNFNRPMTVILSRQLSNSWCSCQQHVKTIWLKFGKLFSTSIQGLLDWVPLSFSVETFSLSVENIFLSPQKKVCSRNWVSWMISIFV